MVSSMCLRVLYSRPPSLECVHLGCTLKDSPTITSKSRPTTPTHRRGDDVLRAVVRDKTSRRVQCRAMELHRSDDEKVNDEEVREHEAMSEESRISSNGLTYPGRYGWRQSTSIQRDIWKPARPLGRGRYYETGPAVCIGSH